MVPNSFLDDLESAALAMEGMDEDRALAKPHLYNCLSLLHQALGTDSWVGLYIKKGDRLLLGPFQGTPACEVIPFSKGVVGACYTQQRVIAVEDVRQFPGYICCDEKAASEICVPLCEGDDVSAVLDIDLSYPHCFNEDEIALFLKVGAVLQRFI